MVFDVFLCARDNKQADIPLNLQHKRYKPENKTIK